MKHPDEDRRNALPPIPEDIPDTAHGSTAPQPPKKIHPDMLEQLDLLGRLERLELLERLAHNRMKVSASGLVARAHEEGDSVVSMAPTTNSSSLRTPTRDREHLEDGHAPPSEQDQARWASAGAAGVALQRQHHELAPASSASCTSFASMVIKIKSESVKLHEAVALYNSERQRTPADDAVALSPPAARSRSSSPLSLWTLIPKEIPEAKDCPGPHPRRNMHDAPTWERSEPEFDLSSASAMKPLPGEHCDGEGEERKAPSWPKFEGPMEEWPLSPSLSQWPHHQKAHGELTLKSFAEQRERSGRRAVCLIQDGVLTLHITQRDSQDSPCAGRRQRKNAAVTTVKVPLGELGVGLQRGRGDMFTIATLHEQSMHDDEICCFASDQSERDAWIAIFERMGVTIFDSSCAEALARCTLSTQEH
jgi:hypothetical protein